MFCFDPWGLLRLGAAALFGGGALGAALVVFAAWRGVFDLRGGWGDAE